MPEAALFIGWGAVVHGRERQALEAFNEVLAYYARLQKAGEIASFEPVALEPHGGDLAGFLLIRGEREQLARVRGSEEFQHFNNRGSLMVEHLGVVSAFVGEELQRQYADFGAQAAALA
jgi:hypothetical protein